MTTIDRDRLLRTDEAFFGLRDGDEPGRLSFLNTEKLARPDEKLFGGTAVGVSLAAMERVTGRTAVWATTQFSSTATVGSVIDLHVEELARGRRTTQARITGSVGGSVVFAALGAAVVLKEGGLRGDIARRPDLEPPTMGPHVFKVEDGHRGWHTIIEMRRGVPRAGAAAADADHLHLWVRMRDGEPFTAGRLGFVSDLVPIAICRALGRTGAGTSLDNTLRFGELVASEWVLLDLRPDLAYGGYGTGHAFLWAEDGTLLGVASQSSSIVFFDFDPLDRRPSSTPT